MSDAVEKHIGAALSERTEVVRLVDLARQRKSRGVKPDNIVEAARVAHRKCFTSLQRALDLMSREAARDLNVRIYGGWQWEEPIDNPERRRR